MTATDTVLDPTRVYTVPEAAAILRVGVRTFYAAAARGEIPTARIGRRIVVPGAQLVRFLGGEVTPTAAMSAALVPDTQDDPRD
jgi:excisionase family DNA binding protein